MKKIITGVFLCMLVALYFVSCDPDDKPEPPPTDEVLVSADGDIPNREMLDQGLTAEQSDNFWFTDQGARIMPYVWFTWLEQPDNEALFRNTEHMQMIGYLPEKTSKINPSGLPIGFSISAETSYAESYVGLTCAACHTNQINYKGKKYLVEGAPTLANFNLFFDRLVDAVNITHDNAEKFERFAKRVLGDSYSEDGKKALHEKLGLQAKALKDRQMVNVLPDHYPADFTSFARLDAFGEIENAGTAFAINVDGVNDLNNKNFPTAPVSYPFLWGTHQSDVVQWNASAPNIPRLVGPIIRNIGEVVGVFGGLKINTDPNAKHGFDYSSSVNIYNLGVLEGYVANIKSPQWPSSFPAIDQAKAERGEKLYKQYCGTTEKPSDKNPNNCHQVIPRDNEYEDYISVKTPLADVGTDRETAVQAATHQALSLNLEGAKSAVVAGPVFETKTPSIGIPVNGVIGLVLKSPIQIAKADLATSHIKQNLPLDERIQNAVISGEDLTKGLAKLLKKQEENAKKGLVYKARPLNGIWATAPYLHNGSVPNLWQLLQLEDQRAPSFWVGSHEFDATNVGFIATEGKNEFQVLDSDGKIMPGNSNRGHTYGTQLEDNQKWDLIEYIKTL